MSVSGLSRQVDFADGNAASVGDLIITPGTTVGFVSAADRVKNSHRGPAAPSPSAEYRLGYATAE
jgi:hypothetical protein